MSPELPFLNNRRCLQSALGSLVCVFEYARLCVCVCVSALWGVLNPSYISILIRVSSAKPSGVSECMEAINAPRGWRHMPLIRPWRLIHSDRGERSVWGVNPLLLPMPGPAANPTAATSTPPGEWYTPTPATTTTLTLSHCTVEPLLADCVLSVPAVINIKVSSGIFGTLTSPNL